MAGFIPRILYPKRGRKMQKRRSFGGEVKKVTALWPIKEKGAMFVCRRCRVAKGFFGCSPTRIIKILETRITATKKNCLN